MNNQDFIIAAIIFVAFITTLLMLSKTTSKSTNVKRIIKKTR